MAQQPQRLSCAQMEEFLRLGKMGVQRVPKRATLEHNGQKHDAAHPDGHLEHLDEKIHYFRIAVGSR